MKEAGKGCRLQFQSKCPINTNVSKSNELTHHGKCYVEGQIEEGKVWGTKNRREEIEVMGKAQTRAK